MYENGLRLKQFFWFFKCVCMGDSSETKITTKAEFVDLMQNKILEYISKQKSVRLDLKREMKNILSKKLTTLFGLKKQYLIIILITELLQKMVGF